MKPVAVEIQEARLQVNLSQRQAAELVHAALRSWENWEGGQRKMPRATWDLFRLRMGLVTLAELQRVMA